MPALLPNGEQYFTDNNGEPLAGGKVWFYYPNTQILKDTWTDPNGVTLNTNPVILDAAGRAVIYGTGQYRQIVTDADDNEIWDKLTADPLFGAGSQPFGIADGTLSNPGLYFVNETNSGIRRISTNEWSLVVGAADMLVVAAAGLSTDLPFTGISNFNYADDESLLHDSRNILIPPSTYGGYLSDYDCKAANTIYYVNSADLSAISGGAQRDALFVNLIDRDGTDYGPDYMKGSDCIRAYVQGNTNGSGILTTQFKDMGALNVLSNTRTGPATNFTTGAIGKGSYGILAVGINYGTGIADNEFWAQNPAGLDQVSSMCAGQFIIDAGVGDADADHVYTGISVGNIGDFTATAGISLYTISDTVFYEIGLDMSGSVVTEAGIVMPRSATGQIGTVTLYDPNDYTFYDRTNNRFNVVIGGATYMSVKGQGVAIGQNYVVIDSTYVLQLPNDALQKAKAYAWDTYSTAKAKSNIADMQNCLDRVMKLRPRCYEHSGQRSLGFVLEEFAPIVPELASLNEEGDGAITYGPIVALVAGAVQELYRDTRSKFEVVGDGFSAAARSIKDVDAGMKSMLAQLTARVEKLEQPGKAK